MSKDKIDERYDYFAFISYTEENTKKAQELKKKLTHYRFPKDVREERTDLPSWIRPVFEWKTDTSGGDLRGKDSQINNALFNSKYLIVICSPQAVKSEPVNCEIRDFIKWGREKYIIPFIVDGQPHAENPEEECFPPALLELEGDRERKGIFIDNINEDYAAISVVSTMFDIKVNDLWKPYEREQKQMIHLRLGVAVLLAVIGFAATAIFMHLNRELDVKNKELDKRNKEVVAARNRADEEAKRANSERDRAESANASLLLANDSLTRQYALIERQKGEILLERNNAIFAKNSLEISMSRLYAGKALDLVREGDSYLARYYALHALPPYLPYTIEAEKALRESMLEDNAILHGHNSKVGFAVFSPNGRRILTIDNMLHVWDAESGQSVTTMEGNYNSTTVLFSPKGNRFLTISGKDIFVWDSETGKHDIFLFGHSDVVNSASFSPDGSKIVSASSDKTMRVWDVESGLCIKILHGHKDKVNTATYNYDGGKVVSASSDGTIRVWDTNTWLCVNTLEGEGDIFLSASFSPDGKSILSTSPKKISIWDAEKGICKRILEEGYADAYSANYSDDGRRILIVLSDFVTDGMAIQEIKNGHMFYPTAYDVVHLWDTKTWQCVETYKNAHSAAFSKDGKFFVLASNDNVISIWNSETGKCVSTRKGHNNEINSVVFSHDGEKVLSASSDHTVRLWDIGSNWSVQSKIITNATISSDGKKILTMSADNKLRVWDAESERCVHVLDSFYIHGGLCFDGRSVAMITSNKTIRIIDPWTGWDVQTIKIQDSHANFASFNSSGQRIVAVSGNKIHIWDIQTTMCLCTMGGNGEIINSVVFSHDGKMILSASSDGIARIWNIRNRKCIHTFVGHDDAINYAVFSKDGRMVVTVSKDHTARIWDAESEECLHVLVGHGNDVLSADFSPDGKKVVTGSTDGTLCVWDVGSGCCIQSIKGHHGGVKAVAFTPNGQKIISASLDNTVRIWDIPPLEQLIRETKYNVPY